MRPDKKLPCLMKVRMRHDVYYNAVGRGEKLFIITVSGSCMNVEFSNARSIRITFPPPHVPLFIDLSLLNHVACRSVIRLFCLQLTETSLPASTPKSKYIYLLLFIRQGFVRLVVYAKHAGVKVCHFLETQFEIVHQNVLLPFCKHI